LHKLFHGSDFDDHILRIDVDIRLEVVLRTLESRIAHDCAHEPLQVINARVHVCLFEHRLALAALLRTVAQVVGPSAARWAHLTNNHVIAQDDLPGRSPRLARLARDASASVKQGSSRDKLVFVPARVIMPLRQVVQRRKIRLPQYFLLAVMHEVAFVFIDTALLRQTAALL